MRPFLVAALTGLAAALLAPSGANAASCWQRVLDDWRDGHLDATYSVHCYRDALENMPEDLRVYGAAQNDIQNALSRALARAAVPSPPAAHGAAPRSPAPVTPAVRPRQTPTTAPASTRALAAHSSKQPELRLAAAATPDEIGSG